MQFFSILLWESKLVDEDEFYIVDDAEIKTVYKTYFLQIISDGQAQAGDLRWYCEPLY